MAEKTQKIQPHKIEAIKKVKEMIQGSRDLIFTDYRGLTVAQISELRESLRSKKTAYRVVKNNYTRLALSELGLPYDDEFLTDPTALALVASDVGLTAKMLFDFTRGSSLKIKGGLIEGRVTSSQQVEAISRLPGREQLYAMLMGTMQAPLSYLVYAMNAVVSKLVRTLQAVADSKAK